MNTKTAYAGTQGGMAMARSAPIAALDSALEVERLRLEAADKVLADTKQRHKVALDEVTAARSERMNAYYAADSIEKAIKSLGYVLLAPKVEVPSD